MRRRRKPLSNRPTTTQPPPSPARAWGSPPRAGYRITRRSARIRLRRRPVVSWQKLRVVHHRLPSLPRHRPFRRLRRHRSQRPGVGLQRGLDRGADFRCDVRAGAGPLPAQPPITVSFGLRDRHDGRAKPLRKLKRIKVPRCTFVSIRHIGQHSPRRSSRRKSALAAAIEQFGEGIFLKFSSRALAGWSSRSATARPATDVC
jgi:hypothetical protein